MGYPGKNHKSYQTPKRPWEKSRIESETRLVIEYGLRNKREVWKAQEHLRKYRKAARNLLALGSGALRTRTSYDSKKEELISHLQRAGLLGPDANIDDVLSLKVQTRARTPSPDHCVPQGTRTVAETGPAADHPRPYRDCRAGVSTSPVTMSPGRTRARLPITARPRSLATPIQKKSGLPNPHQTPSRPPVDSADTLHGEG